MKSNQDARGGQNPLFENITVGIAIVCALVAVVTALIARG